MEALVKASRQKGFKEVPGKQAAVAPRKLEPHQPTRYVSLPKRVEVLTQSPKPPDDIAADFFKHHEHMLMIKPLTSPKPPVSIPEALRYNFNYKNGCVEFTSESNASNSNLLNEPVSSASGPSKAPRESKLAEVRATGKLSPGGNSKHTSPRKKSNIAGKASKPVSTASGSPIMRPQKELEPVKKPLKLDKLRKLNAKHTLVNDPERVSQSMSSPVELNTPSASESAGQCPGHDVCSSPAGVPGKENSGGGEGRALHVNAGSPRDDLAHKISGDPFVGDADVLSLKRIRRPAPRLKVRDDNSSGHVGLMKKSPSLSYFDGADGNQPHPPREGGGRATDDPSPTERRVLVSPSQTKRLAPANAPPRDGGSGGKEDRSLSSRGVCKSRGGILPPLAIAERCHGTLESDRSQSPQLSVVELSNLSHGGLGGGKEASKERARPAGDGLGPRAPPLSTNSKLERLQQQLQSQDAKMRQLRKKERSWEEQVKQLKVELRNAREKERALYKIVGVDPKLPRRAETAPDLPCVPKEKPHNGAGFVRRPHDPQRSPPPDGVRPRVCDNKSDFLKAHIFSRNTFRAITAPELPDVGGRKNYSALRMTVQPLLNALVPVCSAKGDGAEEIEHSGEESLKLASLNTRQTALCLPHETDRAVTPVGIHFGHLMQFVNAQIITQQQAERLWGFLCARKQVVYVGTNIDECGLSGADADVGSVAGEATKGAVIPLYDCIRSPAQSRSPLREYGTEHFESSQQVPVLTKALRRKIEDLHLKNAQPKMSPLLSDKEAAFDSALPCGSCDSTTILEFSLASTNNTTNQELSSGNELEKVTEVIHLPEFQSTLQGNVGHS